MPNPNTGRIAISFGTNPKPSSKPSKPASTLGKRPRPAAGFGAAAAGGSDSEGDSDAEHARHEAITGFGADGAESERKGKDRRTEKKDFVIARQPNRDWRAEVKAQRRGGRLPDEARQQQQNGNAVETEPPDQDKGIKWGLTIKEKKDETPAEELAPAISEERKLLKANNDDDGEEAKKPEQSEDDRAMNALLGRESPEPSRVIHPTEEDAYKRDISAAGADSTLEDYEAMPVEEFGAALLRGMGWDGKDRGPKTKEVKRRPNRLGLGAKELNEKEDLGGWEQKKRRPRLDEYRREEAKKKERRRDESHRGDRDRDRDSRYGRDRGYDDRRRDRHRDERDRRR